MAGILGETIRNNEKAAYAIVNASFSNATYSDRIWMYQGMMKAELSKLLQEGLIQGKNPRQLATHLEKLFGVSKSNAQRLMRTELARVQTEAQKRSFERNGFTQYEFIALGSACGICKELDGKHFDVEKMMPETNAPPIHPNCRCSVAAYEDSEEYEAWLDFLDKGGTTEEWNWMKEKELESDIGDKIIEHVTGIEKQKNMFKAGLKNVKNKDVKVLLEQALQRTKIVRAKGRRSKYSKRDGTISLAKTANSDTLAHELFHEIDVTYGLTANGMLMESVRNDYKKLQNFSVGYGKSIEEMLYSKYRKAFRSDTKQLIMKEEYRAISDIINGMSQGTVFLGYGHDKEYWEKKGNIEAEVFAQFGRIMYSSSSDTIEMMKNLFPECFDEMLKRVERMIK